MGRFGRFVGVIDTTTLILNDSTAVVRAAARDGKINKEVVVVTYRG